MKRYAKYVEAHQSLVELSKQLAELPSPRSKFFNYLLGLTKLAPNTLKMVLCTTDSGIEPGREVKKLLSKELNVSEQALFPENRQTAGSLVSMYKGFSNKPLEYDEFVKDICTTTTKNCNQLDFWEAKPSSPCKKAHSGSSWIIFVSPFS